MNQTKVLLLFGGESSEHDVSVMSARNVYDAMDNKKYEVTLCHINQEGDWHMRYTFDGKDQERLLPMLGKGHFVKQGMQDVIAPDVILPILHGDNGEDGSVQGLAQLLHTPIVGCNVTASAICWDKLLTKQLLAANGVPVVPYVVYRRGETLPRYEQLAMTLGHELFVKPATAGSSVGVSKVNATEKLGPAIATALKNSDAVLIEKAIVGRELEVAVLGTSPNHKVSGVGEIIPGEEFYSYEDKYSTDSKAQVITDAALSDELKRQLQATAHKAFAVLGCKGLARVDFLVAETGEAYINELNTLPGFTNISQYPKLWQESGVSYSQLIDTLITDALQQ